MVDNYNLSKHFEQAADDIKKFKPDMNNDELKLLYGLFKQATIGDNNTEAPSFYQLKEKGKWQGWTDQKGKSKDQARHEYVQLVLKKIPKDAQASYQ